MACPVCSNLGVFLGKLGRLFWFRCRACGMDYNVDVDNVDTSEDSDE